MKSMNSRFLTRSTLAVLACAGFAFGCVNNGSEEAYRDDAGRATTPDTTSGTSSSAYDAATVSGTTAAPVVPSTMPAATTDDAAAPVAVDSTDKKAMKKDAKRAHKADKHKKTDTSSNDDFGADGAVVMTDENLMDEGGTEVADPTIASSVDLDEDATSSGATSPAGDTPLAEEPVMTEVPAPTASASDEDLRHAAKLAGALSPWYTEPYSRIPTRVGSTGLSGKDKNLATLEKFSPFIDPPALERELVKRDTIRPVSEIDFNSFGYDRRNNFAAQMNSRLANIDSRIDVLEAKPEVARDELKIVQLDQNSLENQIGDVRMVDESNWDSYRNDFRERLTALEREVARLSVSMR